ncbi:MAG: Dps family protein [Vicinamibacterales bacterium]
MKIDIGIDEKHRVQIAAGLAKVLADTYLLYLKTHGFHWNVTGPQFQALHTLFMTQYTEMATAVDEIAERIRALGVFAPASYAQFSKLASVREEGGAPPAETMVGQLVEGHETLVRTIRAALPVAQEAHDEATIDLLVGRLGLHEKTAWMLRAMLG